MEQNTLGPQPSNSLPCPLTNIAYETGINKGLEDLHGVVSAVVVICHDLIDANCIMVSYPRRWGACEVLRSNTGRDLTKYWGKSNVGTRGDWWWFGAAFSQPK